MLLTGSELVVKCLVEQGVDTIFGYPGGAVIPLYDALYKHPVINHILTCHEQAAAHAADGYARATGRPGVCVATSGPGATNLVTGIATAYMDSVPLVAITGQVPCSLLGKDSFQEVDITGITLPITKHSFLVKDFADIPRVFAQAFQLATSGRPGPVLIDIPKDVFLTRGEYKDFTPKKKEQSTLPPLNPLQITRAAKAIAAAKKPVIYAGGGIVRSGCQKELLQLAEKNQIPVVNSLMGLGSFPRSHPLSLGMVGMHGTAPANLAVTHADLLIAIGARFSDRVTGNLAEFAPAARILQIDIDPAEIGKNLAVDIPVIGDASKVLQTLCQQLTSTDHSEWIAQIKDWQAAYPLEAVQTGKKIKPQYVIAQLAQLAPDDAIIATDVGQHQMFTAQHYPFRKNQTFLTSGGLGTMGYSLPAAIGAKVGCPDKKVIVITGDGGFRMNSNELATAVRSDLDITILVFNNTSLGMVRQWQDFFCEKRFSSTLLKPIPDFVKLAAAFGAQGIRIDQPDQLTEALSKALRMKGQVLVDCWIDPNENVLPMVPAGGAIYEMLGVPGLSNVPREDKKTSRQA
ncbi:MAG: biosynthetic-type acetolactate synthase large subunit [bacterium]|jgi:acetolactate synthase-1/2/3 large subunit